MPTSNPLDERSDESLIHELASGDVSAMETLYQRYSTFLYSLAYHMVADRIIAEDLVQEAFLAVWRHAASYSPHLGTVRIWLITIMHHRAIDYIRSARHRSRVKEIPWEEVEQDERTAHPDVWRQGWQSVQDGQVREALMELPAEQRLVIELAYFQGWTHEEIAEGCQLPLGTVKGRIRRGLLHLKRKLEWRGMRER